MTIASAGAHALRYAERIKEFGRFKIERLGDGVKVRKAHEGFTHRVHIAIELVSQFGEIGHSVGSNSCGSGGSGVAAFAIYFNHVGFFGLPGLRG